MNKKAASLKIFIILFAVSSILHFSADFLTAQCGNYFKPNYSAIDKAYTGFISPNALNDWTGDGKLDFWNFRRNPATLLLDVVIYPSKPTGYWDWNNPIIYTTTIPNYQLNSTLIVKDFNSDGRTDLLYGNINLQINYNTGNGALTVSPVLSDTDGGTGNVGFADLNGDNLLDWIYTIGINANPVRIELRYQLQNSDGTFSNKHTILVATDENGLANAGKYLGDFNGDGRTDIIYSSIGSKYVIITNRGGGVFEAAAPVTANIFVYTEAIRDFNNDGKADILNESAIFYGQADGALRRVPFSIDYGSRTIPAELNGDDNLDIVEYNQGSYATHINNGAGGFTRTVYQGISTPTGSRLIFEDFSGDGKADFYAAPSDSFSSRNIFGEPLLTVRENVCQPFNQTKMADIDGNGKADVITWNPTTGNWSSKNAVWGTGADVASRNIQWGLGAHGDVPAPGDFDGDGKTDYSVYRNSTGVWYIFRSSDLSWMVFQFGLTGDIAVPNDYDGGGKTDIAVFRPSNGGWYIWHSETQRFLGVQFGLNGDKPVPADYDGDGKTDIAVFRPSTGVWYYLKSSDNSFAAILWGISTDKPVPADYDGDGKADLTIYRDGVWWILRSSNNSYAAIQWGTAGDIPIPVYRNSISADLTFYRPSNNSWNSFDYRYAPGITIGGNQDVPVYFGLPNN